MNKIRQYSDVVQRLKNLNTRADLSLINLGTVGCSLAEGLAKDGTADDYELYYIKYNHSKHYLHSLRQRGANSKTTFQVGLFAGIHGDEPAGVETILHFLEHLDEYAELITDVDLVIFPCDNPYGYERDMRENAQGLDLNQQFHNPDAVGELRLITPVIRQIPFDLTLDFHEDVDSPAFYLWERKLSARSSIARSIIQQVSQKYPIYRQAGIEGFPNQNGVIELLELNAQKGWTRGYYMYQHGTQHCLILETPTSASMDERVEMNLIAFRTALKFIHCEV